MAQVIRDESCVHCDEVFTVVMDAEGFARWQQGLGYIQDELPDLKSWERELLLSGTCDKCWTQFFGDEE